MSKLVKDIDMGYGTFKSRMDRIARTEPFVKVGFLGGSDTEVVTYASANEFGTRDGKTPERSFLRSTVRENGFAIFKKTEKFLETIEKPTGKSAVRFLGELGLFIEDKIVKKITSFRDPGNAPSTILQKGEDNPLIDEGRMRNAVASEVAE